MYTVQNQPMIQLNVDPSIDPTVEPTTFGVIDDDDDDDDSMSQAEYFDEFILFIACVFAVIIIISHINDYYNVSALFTVAVQIMNTISDFLFTLQITWINIGWKMMI